MFNPQTCITHKRKDIIPLLSKYQIRTKASQFLHSLLHYILIYANWESQIWKLLTTEIEQIPADRRGKIWRLRWASFCVCDRQSRAVQPVPAVSEDWAHLHDCLQAVPHADVMPIQLPEELRLTMFPLLLGSRQRCMSHTPVPRLSCRVSWVHLSGKGLLTYIVHCLLVYHRQLLHKALLWSGKRAWLLWLL